MKADRGPWALITCGAASWTTADLIFTFSYNNQPPYPSVADVFYLAFYPLCYVGLLLLVRRHLADFNRSLWLDGLTAALGAAALGAAVLIEIVLETTSGSRSIVVTNLAYPIGDVLLAVDRDRRLRRQRLASRARVALHRAWFSLPGRGRRRIPLPVGDGDVCARSALRCALAARDAAPLLGCVAAARLGAAAARGQDMARDARSRCSCRHRHPRLRPRQPSEPACFRPCRRHARSCGSCGYG